MISRLKALKNRNKQAKSWHYIYVKFPMRLCEINDLRAARRLALSPGAAADRHTRPIGVDDELLAGKPVVALGAADLEGAGAVDGQCLRQLGRQTPED